MRLMAQEIVNRANALLRRVGLEETAWIWDSQAGRADALGLAVWNGCSVIAEREEFDWRYTCPDRAARLCATFYCKAMGH